MTTPEGGWIARDLKYNWHPYTQMKDCKNFPPILIERAKGIKLYDNKGNFYYDTISSWWCNIHGHSHPLIQEAIANQIKKLDHVLFAGFTHKNAIILAEKLIGIAPKNITKIFFSDNGSTAVETALKMSLQYWQNIGIKKKTQFICLDSGYHGDTVGAMSVSGMSLFNEKFKPLMFRSIRIPSPYCYRCPMDKTKKNCGYECLFKLEEILKKKSSRISGVILEPLVMAAGGMIIYPVGYLKKLSTLARKYKIHLILDEVATGFGRTGKMFACEYVKNIKPDFMCLSKGITSGTLALGATLTTDKIYNTFYADYKTQKTFYHGHTYTANPIACSAAIASLEIFKKENTLDRIKSVIKFFHKELNKFNNLKLVGDIRHIGMIGAIELVKDKNTKEPFDFEKRIGLSIYKEGLRKNLILRPLGNVVYFYLPLCITKEQLKFILSATYKIIKEIKIKK